MSAPLLAGGIFLFGGLGSAARFAVHQRIVKSHPSEFPLGTFIVNILGAFLLGLLHGADAIGAEMELAGVGFLGGFTTFSTWMYESERLAVDGYVHGAARNLAISSAVGYLAVVLGVAVGRAC